MEKSVEDQTRELRESRERYRRLVEGLQDEYLFYATDTSGILTYVSPSLHSILGYTPQQVIGRNWREFVDPAGPGYDHLELMDELRRSGIPTPLYSAPIPHANGETRMLEFRDMPLRDSRRNAYRD